MIRGLSEFHPMLMPESRLHETGIAHHQGLNQGNNSNTGWTVVKKRSDTRWDAKTGMITPLVALKVNQTALLRSEWGLWIGSRRLATSGRNEWRRCAIAYVRVYCTHLEGRQCTREKRRIVRVLDV